MEGVVDGRKQWWMEAVVHGRSGGWKEWWMEGVVDGSSGGWKKWWMEAVVDGRNGGWKEWWMEGVVLIVNKLIHWLIVISIIASSFFLVYFSLFFCHKF